MNITGLIHVTGEHDTGKTVFALSCGAPLKRIAFIDDDMKGRATINQIGVENFGMYYDLVHECTGQNEIQQHEIILRIIADIESQGFDAVIWDTWTRAGKTTHHYVKKYPMKFRESYSQMGEIKGAEQAGEANRYEAELLDRLLYVSPLVIVTTHLKDQRKNLTGQKSVLTGKLEPDARRSIEEKSNFRVWLRHNPDGTPQPIGLVLKRPIKWEVVDGKMFPVNVLPRKIVPCTWEKIKEYWSNPMGSRVPLESEMPDKFELTILDGTLTDDQKVFFNAAIRESANEIPILFESSNGNESNESTAPPLPPRLLKK